MSASPDAIRRSEDEIISLLSRWLARHLDTAHLRQRLEAVRTDMLPPEQAEVVDEVLGELGDDVSRARLEPVVREAVEALALGLY
jgi:hypothetical protein